MGLPNGYAECKRRNAKNIRNVASGKRTRQKQSVSESFLKVAFLAKNLQKKWYTATHERKNSHGYFTCCLNRIPVPLRGYAYCPAIKIGDEKVWDFVWQRYEKSNVETEKLLFLYILGCSRNKKLLTR